MPLGGPSGSTARPSGATGFPGFGETAPGITRSGIAHWRISMRSFDLAPLFRASVGFDNLTRVLDSVTRLDDAHFAYPPYNIVKSGDDKYRITFAVAGFGPEEIDVQVENNTLTVKGRPVQDQTESVYLHRGIA